MRATLVLAEAAQVADGKLNILGGGWSETGPGPMQMAIGILIEFTGAEANGEHHFELFLTGADHQPVFNEGPNGSFPIEVRGDATVNLPADFDTSVGVPWPVAVNVPGLALTPASRFQWNLVVDGTTDPGWVLAFRTRPPVAG